ncbi:MAG: trypsin-like peptidase domain-containing protein [Bacteroidota bacterium]
MKNRSVVILLIPFFLVFILWVGFLLGRKTHSEVQSEPELAGSQFPFEAQAVPAQYQTRDTISADVTKSRRNAITRTVAAVSPAVVGINVTEIQEYTYRDPFEDFFNDPFFRQFFGNRQGGSRKFKQELKGLGSGFIISPDGYIVTNDHVAGRASEILVTLTNGEKYKAKVIGTDGVSDICLLKINGNNLPYVRLGNSDDVIIGEWVIAFGNPFGLFEISNEPTVTVGVVSATKMNIPSDGGRVYRGMIQTDAAINSGNSGGPLSNSLGEIIGMNTLIFTPNQGNIGVGFAIPINRMKAVLTELKNRGKVERDFWTGLRVQQVDESIARAVGLAKPEGVIINDVENGSPADKAGVKEGDIILEVNGEKITSGDSIEGAVNYAKTGDVLHLKILRDRKVLSIDLKLERRSS